jgi:SAM-dependent methyltransferase
MSDSVGFDRAAEFYDASRAIAPEAMERTIELLASELRGRGRALEVGIGTGLLALPLRQAGVELAGIDLSGPTIGKLVEKAGGRAPFPPRLPTRHGCRSPTTRSARRTSGGCSI